MNTPRYRSLCIAFLMVVLIFSRSFAALAQQKSVEVQAKIDAEHDAETDMNRKEWIDAGIVSYGSMLLGGLVFSLGRSDAGYPFSDRDLWAMLGMCVGCLVSGTLIYNYKLEPPPERFIGKPPVYIDVYTDTYKTKTRWLRMRWAGAGCAVGSVVTSGVVHLIRLVR